ATPWLARRFGILRAYGAVVLGFTVASAGCALVPSVGLLVVAGVVRGLAGAPMVPLAMSLILAPSRSGDRGRGMPASAGIVLFAAPALGPAFGGLLISAFGWRSVFLVNVPVGLLALAGVRAARRPLPPGWVPLPPGWAVLAPSASLPALAPPPSPPPILPLPPPHPP